MSKIKGTRRVDGIKLNPPSVVKGNKDDVLTIKRRIITASVKPQKEIIPTYDNMLTVYQTVGTISWSNVYDALEKRWSLYRLMYNEETNSEKITQELSELVKVNENNRWDDEVSYALFFASFCDFQNNVRCNKKLENWFVLCEMRVYLARIETLSLEALSQFLVKFGYHPQQITVDEEGFLKQQNYFQGPFIKVPFFEAGKNLKNRRLLLYHGSAFIEKNEVIDMVIMKNREKLQERVKNNYISPALGKVPYELKPILEYYQTLVMKITGLKTATTGFHVETCSKSFLKESGIELFPPCMYSIYRKFLHDKHLKHFGLLQLIMFLKGVGLSMEDCKKFFEEIEPLSKERIYNIEHSYGRAGAKIDYTGYGCNNLISQIRNAGDCNGCMMTTKSFKQEDIEDNLLSLMELKGIDEIKREEILQSVIDLIISYQPTHACTKFLYLSQNKPFDDEIQDIIHPNTYFLRAKRLVNEQNRQSLEKLITDLDLDSVGHQPSQETPMEEEKQEEIKQEEIKQEEIKQEENK
ncbi:DNA primase large subunit, putative [Entamoeba histolytica HM-1:IMSS-B]|uniref:DNA primase large subunit, putative n=6 Tax=Entamoeba histolytica TaxID=5759 RepID=C4M6L8_ENTH1|nr:DNA primase large subunit, putative [Entamoeba histolytica HM-1:IMSS]EAL49139.1 DNA primase large subunit, putative [Entamoeba histolytica HM-1:IMSS]EMH76829.1 DNA primase large subunit, putative [Entamoeba histolytica HM-1:IMSS-B]EMS10966.1 DNA primase large subunit [Entamoeba histolytica HM-3:IMSS]ENY61226.1 DNA primase large subunit, putative [Entamoeba histolytica HM-1:IMSS-A]|eukprot:XP_654525.1 DNA primase large subunit, putative [Entamoeba histolytica HM-1:IMSS]